jgi:hypothetical protein
MSHVGWVGPAIPIVAESIQTWIPVFHRNGAGGRFTASPVGVRFIAPRFVSSGDPSRREPDGRNPLRPNDFVPREALRGESKKDGYQCSAPPSLRHGAFRSTDEIKIVQIVMPDPVSITSPECFHRRPFAAHWNDGARLKAGAQESREIKV